MKKHLTLVCILSLSSVVAAWKKRKLAKRFYDNHVNAISPAILWSEIPKKKGKATIKMHI